MAAAVAGGLPGKGHDISLAALRRHDPYINRIVDVASQVALYTFGHRANEWEKTDVEGTLFVYTRSASPKHGFTIMNRLSMENRTEPITKDLDFQLQDPFLLYRNARLSIYGIWFYDKEECQRIAELMKHLTEYEQLKACHGAGAGPSPVTLSSGDGREVDILQMLTKAKDEYTKCKTCSEPKQMTSSAIYDNPNLIKPIPVKPSDNQQQRRPLPRKTLDPEPQHLSLTALFGKKDQVPCQETVTPPRILYQQQQEKLSVHQGVKCSLSHEEPRKLSPPVEKQLCPAIQKLMVRSAKLHPEQQPCERGSPNPTVLPGPIQPGSLWNIRTSNSSQSACRTQKLLEQLQSASRTAQKYNPSAAAPVSPAVPSSMAPVQSVAQSQLVYVNGHLPPPTLGHQTLRKEQCTLPRQALPLPGSQESSPTVLPAQELLRKLQAVQQEQQLQAAPRPALAAKFPVSAQGSGTEKPLEAWVSKPASKEKQAPLLQPTCAPLRETDSRLMALGDQKLPAASPSCLLPLQNWESSTMASRPLTRLQLQEALLNLIQNDDNFLSIIYETYLFSVTQAAMRKTT
uniref:5'-(N(7)-methylguanosine 5'-triphospho)-[mRNA] hydrolase n=1 Tax=Nannospalax galili TaxID=1026970 RepID=A0A8C6WCR5_NANGA